MNREQWDDRMKTEHETEHPSASDIAEDWLNNVNTEYELKSFTDEEQAECYRELIALIASFEFDHELEGGILANHSRFYMSIKDKLEAQIKGAAEQEGFN